MPRVKLFLMRHSKSCSNHLRHGITDDSDPETISVSQGLRDPGLTVEGRRIALRYGPTVRNSLKSHGFDVDHCRVHSSRLRRARQTAALVFQRTPRPLPHFTENGAIPENTPAGIAYAAPDMRRFLTHLSTGVREGESVAVIGHGSFLGSLWPALTGRVKTDRLNNLDGILLDATIDAKGGIQVHSHHEILCPYHVKPAVDRCDPGDQQKITVLRKRMSWSKMKKTKRRSRQSRQRQQQQQGGGVNMPLAYFQDGAQMRGTEGSETGTGLAGMSSGFVREALTQTGGQRRSRRQQQGGFSPSVMGAFAANGARLLPLAAYMGYKMYSNDSSSSGSSHHRRTKKSKRSRKSNR